PFDLRLQPFQGLEHRQGQLHHPLPASDHLEVGLGLPLGSLVFVLHQRLSFFLLTQGEVLTPNSIRVRGESRCFLFQVSTKGGSCSVMNVTNYTTISSITAADGS